MAHSHTTTSPNTQNTAYGPATTHQLTTTDQTAANLNITLTAADHSPKPITLLTGDYIIQNETLTGTILGITFTENTTGYIYWGVEDGQIDTSDGGESFTNTNTILYNQTSLPSGDIIIVFNPAGTQYQQRWVVIKNGTNDINQTIQIQNTSIQQIVKTLSSGAAIEHSRVCAHNFNGSAWLPTYCDFTSENGEATLLLSPQQEYRFTAEATGYNNGEVTRFIPPVSTDIIVIEMTETESAIFNYKNLENNTVTTKTANQNTTAMLPLVTDENTDNTLLIIWLAAYAMIWYFFIKPKHAPIWYITGAALSGIFASFLAILGVRATYPFVKMVFDLVPNNTIMHATMTVVWWMMLFFVCYVLVYQTIFKAYKKGETT